MPPPGASSASGDGPPAATSTLPAGFLDGALDVVAIHDMDLGYRSHPGAWRAWQKAEPAAIVLSTIEPFDDNPLLALLLERYADRLTVVVPIVELRKSGASVGHPLSWERSAEEVDAAVRAHPLGTARRVVVQLELRRAPGGARR